MINKSPLSTATVNQHKTLEIEQALHALQEDARLSDNKMQQEQQRIAQETELQKLMHTLNTLIQQQEDNIAQQAQTARLAREQADYDAELAQELASEQQALAIHAQQLQQQREQQVTHNMVNSADLVRRLIEKLPAIVEKLPDIDELKVLQTSDEDATFNALSQLVAKLMATAEYLGVPLNTDEKFNN